MKFFIDESDRKYIQFPGKTSPYYMESNLSDCVSKLHFDKPLNELSNEDRHEVAKLCDIYANKSKDGWRAFQFSEYSNQEGDWLLIHEDDYRIESTLNKFEDVSVSGVAQVIRGQQGSMKNNLYYIVHEGKLYKKTKNPVQSNWKGQYLFRDDEGNELVFDTMKEAIKELELPYQSIYASISSSYRNTRAGGKYDVYYLNGKPKKRESRGQYDGQYEITNIKTENTKVVDSLKAFVDENGLSYGPMWYVVNGFHNQHKGYKGKKLNEESV